MSDKSRQEWLEFYLQVSPDQFIPGFANNLLQQIQSIVIEADLVIFATEDVPPDLEAIKQSAMAIRNYTERLVKMIGAAVDLNKIRYDEQPPPK